MHILSGKNEWKKFPVFKYIQGITVVSSLQVRKNKSEIQNFIDLKGW